MPELPDVELYLHALRPRLTGHRILDVRVASPFVVRSFAPPIEAIRGRAITTLSRLGKRVVIHLDGTDQLALVIHLMIAGRLQWKPPGAPIPRRLGLMALDVDAGTLILTEAGTTRRASVHVVAGAAALADLDPGGLEVIDAPLETFQAALTRERHTLKRALTDPTIFSGIGNAYSDEILHRARLSPFQRSDGLTPDEVSRLWNSVRTVLADWRDQLIRATADTFPTKVTAFREGMAVHGRYGQPCPACGTTVQRIRYATNEANYCPTCQTGGRLLADRSLSRLMKEDWPRSIEELERRKASQRVASASG